MENVYPALGYEVLSHVCFATSSRTVGSIAIAVVARGLPGAALEQMVHIPLAIQRKLAHDGLFAGYFICNARDAIALETVPHVLRLPDVLAFIRLPRINGQALHTIAKDKTVMREYDRLAFCRNPRAKGPELDGQMSSLSSTDWDAIARDRNASQRAREQAKRLLAKVHA